MTEPTIAQTRRAFSMSCRVEANIRATATPTVSGVVPNERMTWTGGFAPVFKGVRTFGPVFARFASDLKQEAERG
ncbi:MAG TPA: hypothetical protein VGN76_10355 [Gemmatimonadales bacterium]|jgi:hypothetical protein|nr:hypothetical protein [Gemmatimonadales bacterium]